MPIDQMSVKVRLYQCKIERKDNKQQVFERPFYPLFHIVTVRLAFYMSALCLEEVFTITLSIILHVFK